MLSQAHIFPRKPRKTCTSIQFIFLYCKEMPKVSLISILVCLESFSVSDEVSDSSSEETCSNGGASKSNGSSNWTEAATPSEAAASRSIIAVTPMRLGIGIRVGAPYKTASIFVKRYNWNHSGGDGGHEQN